MHQAGSLGGLDAENVEDAASGVDFSKNDMTRDGTGSTL
jgi:hypothetical protein